MRDETARPEAAAAALLDWYDRQARDLPWRVGPAARRAGVRPDPYRVWLSEIMLQQTTVAAVTGYYQRFLARWPDVGALAAAPEPEVMAEWAGLGYYARARNLHKCARLVAEQLGGRFPDTRDGLLALPGVGPYTAAAIAAICFDRPETVVDGNVERVVARYFGITTPLPAAKPLLTQAAGVLTPVARPGCHAQAMMDLGATVCTPRNPACGICPLWPGCVARMQGIAPDLPVKAPRIAKPVRQGFVYVVRRADGAVLLETRPAPGLLGGMPGFPGTPWAEDLPDPAPPLPATWHPMDAEVRHTFTHFHLRLYPRLAVVPDGAVPRQGDWVPAARFRPSTLPSLMRKVWALAEPGLDRICPPDRRAAP